MQHRERDRNEKTSTYDHTCVYIVYTCDIVKRIGVVYVYIMVVLESV